MSSNKIIDIADLDCIYLSYDEPQKEEFWLELKHMIPYAKRVDGVKGSDAAHKAAAEASDTDRFILIDGDNKPDPNFFNLTLDFTEVHSDFERAQFRWKARNIINGLRYGNGGLSSWTKDYAMNMKTHESSKGDWGTQVDFCMDSEKDNLYYHMYDCYSTTYPNYTPFQAWRAGFREGVKMVLERGKPQSIDTFRENVSSRNLNNLTVWHNVGTDVENGIWAIYGSRLGTHMTMLTNWDYRNVMWFDNYHEMWADYCEGKDPLVEAEKLGSELETKLGLPMCVFSPEQSKFFKRHYLADKYNLGLLVREIDVIRKIEGW